MTTSLRRNVLSSLTILVVLGSLMRERQITNVFQTNYTGGGRAKRSLSSSSHNLYQQQAQQEDGEHKSHASSSSSAQTKKQQRLPPEDDIHSRHVTVLPLQEWEQASLRGLYQAQQEPFAKDQQQMANDSCHPPKGIPKACCLGTFAGMGRIIHNRRHQCDPSALEQLASSYDASNDKNEEECHVCALLEQLHQTNQTMAFVGDSMSHQIFQGLLCEFYRRNYQIHETTFHFPLATTKQQQQRGSARGKQQPRKESSSQTTTTTTTEDGHVHVSLPEPTNRRCHGGNSINHCLHMMRRVQISSPLLKSNVTLQFFHQYRLPFADPQQEQMVLTAADILVVNFGLHWGANYNNGILATTNMTTTMDKRRHRPSPRRTQESRMLTAPDNPPTPGHLQNTLAAFLQTAKQSSSRIWIRETSMQHFDADGGDYSFVKHRATKRQQRQAPTTNGTSSVRVERSPVQCVPYFRANTTTTSTTAGWRERVIQEAAHQANYSVRRLQEEVVVPDNNNQRFDSDHASVTILPFADWTKPLYALHPYDDRGGTGGGGGGDCTHYCSSPFLYLPLWKSMQYAMSSQDAGV
ncbi:expressed unknown protein [Seminavis robusta]|uniref:Membrane-associated protein n=1 Tax=Seminavis robusta TaxID=568900 RepID=A0A9N8EJ47_9STRA|nr:expressed unknown protein [Seminavis robusta]|eukprot:Sro1163_g247980.1 n/a (579) ;mRNA; f:20170-21906